jgi:hypothetical protein
MCGKQKFDALGCFHGSVELISLSISLLISLFLSLLGIRCKLSRAAN